MSSDGLLLLTTPPSDLLHHIIAAAAENNSSNLKIFQWNSAKVDWCEENYAVTSQVVEFFNTVSNEPFIVLPLILFVLFRNYTKHVGMGANIVFLLLLIVGVGSTYFHWTLSVIGQMVDQLAIVWVVLGGLTLWFPQRYLPRIFNDDRCLFRKAVMLPLIVVVTCVSFIKPSINSFILMLLAAPIIAILVDEYRSNQDWHVRSLSMRCAAEWFAAIIMWINDKFLCDVFWHHFPYLHAGWHILIAISAYHACVLFCYFDVSKDPQLLAMLRYWPKEGGCWDMVCLPYIDVQSTTPVQKSHSLNQIVPI